MVAFTAQRMGYVGTCLIGVCSVGRTVGRSVGRSEAGAPLQGHAAVAEEVIVEEAVVEEANRVKRGLIGEFPRKLDF